MANNANILPNYSMKGNIATHNLSQDDIYMFNKATGGDIDNTWKNNNKYYYYNLDPSGGGGRNLYKVYNNMLGDGSGGTNRKFSDIDDAIENAACGNWDNSDGICNGEYNPKLALGRLYENRNRLNDPSNNNVTTSLAKFVNSSGHSKDDAINYLISRFVMEKSRFYDTTPAKNDNSQYTGPRGWISTANILAGGGGGNVAKIFVYIVYGITIYLLLVGVKSINVGALNKLGVTKRTPASSSLIGSTVDNVYYIYTHTFKEGKNAIVFILVMFIIFILSGFVFSDKSDFYILSAPSKNFLTEPCESTARAQSATTGITPTICVTIMIIVCLCLKDYFVSWPSIHSGSLSVPLLGYYLSFICLVIILFFYCFDPIKEKQDNKYLVSYNIQDANANFFLPYIFTNSRKINYTFYILLFSVVCIATIISICLSLFNQANSKGIYGYLHPFLSLRSSVVTVLTLLVLWNVPFILVIYPLIILIQRLLVGNLIAPIVLQKLYGENANNKSSEATVLFESLVGWDLLAWPLFKIADIVQAAISGNEKGSDLDALSKKNSASNLNVFSSFQKEIGFNNIIKILLFASPVSFANIINNWTWGNYLKYLIVFLIGIAIFLFGLYIVSFLFIWLGDKNKYFEDKFAIDLTKHQDYGAILYKSFNPTNRGILLWIFMLFWIIPFYRTFNLGNPLKIVITSGIVVVAILIYVGIVKS